mgnify:CR=1 FL=1
MKMGGRRRKERVKKGRRGGEEKNRGGRIFSRNEIKSNFVKGWA